MFNKFATGRKVYGQGSYAPTRGQVNPQGYIQREIRKRNQQAQGQNGGVSQVGPDGQSDTRSGLAAKSLQQNAMAWAKKNGSRQAVAKGPNQPGHGWGPQAVAVGPRGSNGQGNGQGGPSKGPVNANSGTGVINPNGPTPQQSVNINPTGTLELPYSSEYAQQALEAQMNFDADMLSLQEEEQQQSLMYQKNMRDLEEGYQGQTRDTLNQNAASGTAFSSAYGTDVNENARIYNNMKNDLTSQDSMFKSQGQMRRQQAQQALNQMIQMITQSYADSLAEDSGSLGYGTEEERPANTRDTPKQPPQSPKKQPTPKKQPAPKQPPKQQPKKNDDPPHGGWHGPGGGGNGGGGNKKDDDKGKKGKKK